MQKKVLLILAPGFEEVEAITPLDLLRRTGVKVTIAGIAAREIPGAHDIVVRADKLLESTDTEYDALILPGGTPGTGNLANSDIVKTLVVAFHTKNKIIAAICAAPALVLAPLGILNNRSATCYPGMEKNFHQSTQFSAEPVVHSKNIITSRAPGTAGRFALKLIELLIDKESALKIQQATLIS